MKNLALLMFFGAFSAASCSASYAADVQTCEQLGVVPGTGFRAKGTFSNDDYNFSVRIPEHQVAWSGAAMGAPFHGFSFNLVPYKESCVSFYLEWRVNEEDQPERPPNLLAIDIPGTKAGYVDSHGVVSGRPIANRDVYFTRVTKRGIVDGSIRLVSSQDDLASTSRIFDAFVRSLKFDGGDPTGKTSSPPE